MAVFANYEDTWETTTTTGTGTITLGGAVTGWRAFSAQYVDGQQMNYSIYDGTNFEHGIGTYNSAGNTLSRTTVIRSTNSNSQVNWGAGTRQVVVSPQGYISNTNDSAVAGQIGEYVSQAITIGSQVLMTTATVANVASISLTAGDWDLSGNVAFTLGGGVPAIVMEVAITTTSATMPGIPNGGAITYTNLPSLSGAETEILPIATSRLSLAATTTVYLVATGVYTSGTVHCYGFIGARRAR